jgi:hypothetical protein
MHVNAPFSVVVPPDRQGDVASVVTTGQCGDAESVAPDGVFFVRVLGEGTCHVTVTFRSGAPTFQADVPIVTSKTGCCPGELGAQGPVNVPEAPRDAGVRD